MAEDIKDISLSTKKSFRIDGDNSRIIYLDTSDMNIMVRFNETYPEIQKLATDATNRLATIKASESEGEFEEQSPLNDLSEILKDIDKQMRVKVDYIFASEVSDICVPTGNMYDLVNGEFRFSHLIDVLSTLYANNFRAEFKKMQERVKKHTAKYTSKRRK